MRRWNDPGYQRESRENIGGGGGTSRRDGYGPPKYPREYGGGNYRGNYNAAMAAVTADTTRPLSNRSNIKSVNLKEGWSAIRSFFGIYHSSPVQFHEFDQKI